MENSYKEGSSYAGVSHSSSARVGKTHSLEAEQLQFKEDRLGLLTPGRGSINSIYNTSWVVFQLWCSYHELESLTAKEMSSHSYKTFWEKALASVHSKGRLQPFQQIGELRKDGFYPSTHKSRGFRGVLL